MKLRHPKNNLIFAALHITLLILGLGRSLFCFGQSFGPSYLSSSSPASSSAPPSYQTSTLGTKINWTAGERLVARSDWPREFSLILDELQDHLATSEEQEAFLKDLYYLDQAYDVLAKEQKMHLHFLVKAIIYKGLLNWRPKVIIAPNLYAPSSVAALRQKLSSEAWSPLATWFLQGIEKDLQHNLVDASTKNRQAAAMALAWWQSAMAGKASFELDFYPALQNTWHHLAKQIYLQAYFALPWENKSLSFIPTFAMALHNFAKAFIPAEATETAAQQAIKIVPKIDPNLAALWFATPDPDYTPPAVLPTPINDWSWRPAE